MGCCLCVSESAARPERAEAPSHTKCLVASAVAALALTLFVCGMLAFMGVGALSSASDEITIAMLISGTLGLALLATHLCLNRWEAERGSQKIEKEGEV